MLFESNSLHLVRLISIHSAHHQATLTYLSLHLSKYPVKVKRIESALVLALMMNFNHSVKEMFRQCEGNLKQTVSFCL